MTFLIDGYNLMHAAGLVRDREPAKGLAAARRRFLDWLADARPDAGAGRFRVVFDAQNGPAASPEGWHRGVWVRFAYRETADDVIEDLLAGESQPTRLTVVSNDGRVSESARRVGARPWGCEAFMDWLTADPAGTPKPVAVAAEKPDGPAAADEIDALLSVFQKPKPR